MDTPEREYSFIAPVLRQEIGMQFHYLPVPDDIADELAREGVRRVTGTYNGHPIRRAIQGSRDGSRHIILGRDLLRVIGAEWGDMVEVRLRPDPEPDLIEIGDELTAVLEQDEQASERFYSLTPGRRRSLAYYVTSAKRVETRISRALELAEKLRTYTLYSDRHEQE